MIKAVVFDLDGTLLNTLASLAQSYNRVLKQANLPPHEVNAYKQFIGDGARTCVERCLPIDRRTESLIDQLLQSQKQDYLTSWLDDVEIYPGIVKLLKTLRGQGISIAALSNKNHQATQRCIDHFFPNIHFDIVQGYVPEQVPHKPDPTGLKQIAKLLELSAEQVIMIGDTKMDIGTAKRSNMLSIGVLWGFRDKAELTEAKADYIVAHPSEILDVLASLK